jgi:hypothetical protein
LLAGNIRIRGGKRTSIHNYSVRKLIRKSFLSNILCVSDACNVLTDEGAQGTRARSLIPSSLGLSLTSPSSEFLWLLSLRPIYRSMSFRCACAERLDPPLRAASVSPREQAVAMTCARKTYLQREGNLELCTLFSNPQSFPRYYLPISRGHRDNGPILTAIARFEGRPQSGHVHLKSRRNLVFVRSYSNRPSG